jgi:hypothetical protein
VRNTTCCGLANAPCTRASRWFKLPTMSDQTVWNGQARPDDQTQPEGDQARPGDQTETRRRVTVREAARLLDTSVEGVRSRIKRGSLDSMRVQGTVYVVLGQEQIVQDNIRSDQARPDAALYRLVDEQGAMIDWLKREVERKDTIIMSMTQRIPELEASPELQDVPATVSHEDTDKGGDTPDKPQEQVQRRSWFYRFFFGP